MKTDTASMAIRCPGNGLRTTLGFALALFVSSSAKAVSWFPFGPDGGDARSLAADPKDASHLYAGTAAGWIYESHDRGTVWKRLARLSNRDDLVLDNVVVDARDSRHVIVAAFSVDRPEGGLFSSKDAGLTWTSDADMKGQSIRALAQSVSSPKTWVAGTLRGIQRSDDNGEHWSQISPAGSSELHEVESIAIDPTDPNTVYAGTWHLPWKTTDGGHTWNNIKEGVIDDSDVFSIIIDPVHPQTVYVSACSGIYKTDDAGGRFHKVEGIPSEARRTRVLMQDPKNRDVVFAGTTEGLFRTADAGKIWIRVTGPDVIVNDILIDPANPQRILLATDRSGILLSQDGGASFRSSQSGFSARHLSSYVADARNPAVVYVGVLNDKQWGGVYRSDNGGLSWSQQSDGLQGDDIFSLGQLSDGTIVAGTGHGIYRLRQGMWERVALSAVAPTPQTEPARSYAKGVKARPPAIKALDAGVYAFARQGEDLFAATSEGVFMAGSSSASWKSVMPREPLYFLGASQSALVAGGREALFLSRDHGMTWRPVSHPPRLTQISAVAVDDTSRIWAGGREGVFYSGDAGATWQTWNGLNLVDISDLHFDSRSQRLFVTNGSGGTIAYAVQLSDKRVSSWDTGWNLRFVRPVGDHLIGITPFDGVVIQPRMVESAETPGR